MDRPPVLLSMYQERVKGVQDLMREQGVDALLLLTMESYRYFTGDFRRQPRAFVPREGEAVILCFASEKEEVQMATGLRKVVTYRSLPQMMAGVVRYLSSLEVERPRVALEMEFGTPHFLVDRFQMANPTVELVDGRQMVMALRKVKDKAEIENIKKACRLAEEGMRVAQKTIREGVREIEVAVEVEYAMKKLGAERVSFPIFVNSGHRSLWLHGMATPKNIERGDLVLVDLGPVYKGYCADLTRTFVVGNPDERQAHLYSAYLKIQQSALSAITPGTLANQVDREGEKAAREAGYGQYYVRGILHGIGLGFEELPFPTIFPEDMAEPLLPGMTLAVGHNVLSVPGTGGARVEDTVLLTEKGVEVLTRFPNQLMEVG